MSNNNVNVIRPPDVTQLLQQLFGSIRIPDHVNQQIHDIADMFKAALCGEFLPKASLASLIGGILYLIDPFNVISKTVPDNLLDDAVILGIISLAVKYDVGQYKKGKNGQHK